ncbi:MAG: metallophosphoesterase [Pseudomonadota bacterium]
MDACSRHARHTLVVSDLHLTDAQEPLPRKPLWKRYKQRDLFIDGVFDRFLATFERTLPPGGELVLNGDVFDFDSVMALPKARTFPVTWLERHRGLGAEEEKSRFKMRRILRDHPLFVGALRRWVLAGHRVVFVIGNHDIELQWHSVRRDLLDSLELPDGRRDAVRVCEWFYLSNEDTLIEHGNQYDSYCLGADPIHPTIRWRGKERVRVPFGNLAERYMLNAMGLFNPHVDGSFIKSGPEYARFFFRYMIRIQPFIAWTWFWGALVTLVSSLREGFLPAVRDPLHIEDRVADIARRANATTAVVRGLQAIHVHPAIFSPWRIARELWLDRAAILAVLVFGSFQVFSVMNAFSPISPWWAGVVFLLLLPPFLFYARSVQSGVGRALASLMDRSPFAARIAGVPRVVVGHTHIEQHIALEGLELLNTGTWSPAYRDVECTIPYGRKCFTWVRPDGSGARRADLFEWNDPGCTPIPPVQVTEKAAPLLDAARRAARALRRARDDWGPPGGRGP